MTRAQHTVERRKIVVSGRVQGVGFRYTTESYARRIGLVGTVRNRDDGRVEIVAEGAAEPIDQLVRDLRDHFGRGIEKIESETTEVRDGFDAFFIQR